MTKRKRALLSVLVEDDGPFSGPIYCPRCGGRKVHPISVSINPPGDMGGELTVRADGLHIDKSATRWGIAVRIVLTFGCDAGHVWAVDFWYGRGETRAGLLYPNEPKPGHYEVMNRRDGE